MLKRICMSHEAQKQNQAMLKTSQPNTRRTEALETIRDGQIGDCESWFLPEKPTIAQQVCRTVGRILRRRGKKQ